MMDKDNYQSIQGILFKFMQHSRYKYCNVHHQLNGQYGEDIYDIDDFFNTDCTDIANDVNINDTVTALIIAAMCKNGADKTKLQRTRSDPR